MYRTSILVFGLCIILTALGACKTNNSIINSNKVLEKDVEVFELIVQSFLGETSYTKENLLVTTFPIRSDSSIKESVWQYEIELTNIQDNRVEVIKKFNLTEVHLDNYHSCDFKKLVPPSTKQNEHEEELPEYCQRFEETYALAVSIPERVKNNTFFTVQAAIFSNYGYEYYKFTISTSNELSITKIEKIGWIYS